MIIDTHVHIGKILNFDMPEDAVIASMEQYNIDFSLVSNGEAAEFDHQQNPIPKELQFSQLDCFEKTLKFARKYPAKIGVMPWVKVASERPDEVFEQLLKENLNSVFGIKIHPFHSKTPFDSEKVESYIKLAQTYNLPVVTHTGGSDDASPKRVYHMALNYPDVNFVLVHMGLGTDNEEAIRLISQLPNLYGDTTWVPIESTVKLIKLCGSKKIVFGSDNPIDGKDTYYCNKTGERSMYQQYFNELKNLLSEEDYENLMYRNAIKLFHLDKIVK